MNVARTRINAAVSKTLISFYLVTPYGENYSVLLCFTLRAHFQVQNANVKPGFNRDMREIVHATNVCGHARMWVSLANDPVRKMLKKIVTMQELSNSSGSFAPLCKSMFLQNRKA